MNTLKIWENFCCELCRFVEYHSYAGFNMWLTSDAENTRRSYKGGMEFRRRQRCQVMRKKLYVQPILRKSKNKMVCGDCFYFLRDILISLFRRSQKYLRKVGKFLEVPGNFCAVWGYCFVNNATLTYVKRKL